MSSFKINDFKWALATACVLATSAASAATTLTFIQFNTSALSGLGGWQFGSQSGGSIGVVMDAQAALNGSLGSVQARYPTASGGVYAWGVYNMASLKANDVYVEFWAKMPGAKQGLKFLKIFGATGSGYANTTFGLDYSSGSMSQVSFGDGSGSGNDTANVINLDGSEPDMIGRSYGKAVVQTPQKSRWASSNWGTSWHHFRLHCKFNSGTTAANETPDGEYYVEIDGKVYVDAKGLFNRHYSNAPIERIELYGWSQSGSQPFELWYDDVRITTGGFAGSGPTPDAASNVRVN